MLTSSHLNPRVLPVYIQTTYREVRVKLHDSINVYQA